MKMTSKQDSDIPSDEGCIQWMLLKYLENISEVIKERDSIENNDSMLSSNTESVSFTKDVSVCLTRSESHSTDPVSETKDEDVDEVLDTNSSSNEREKMISDYIQDVYKRYRKSVFNEDEPEEQEEKLDVDVSPRNEDETRKTRKKIPSKENVLRRLKIEEVKAQVREKIQLHRQKHDFKQKKIPRQTVEDLKAKAYFRRHARLASMTKEEREAYNRRRTEKARQWRKSLTGEKRERYMEYMRNYQKISRPGRLDRYSCKIASETPAERQKRLRRIKIKAAAMRLRMKLKAAAVSKEEIEARVAELKLKLEVEPLPPMDSNSTYIPRPWLRKAKAERSRESSSASTSTSLIPWHHALIKCNLCGESASLGFSEFAYHIHRYHQHRYGCTQCLVRFHTYNQIFNHWKSNHKTLLDTTPTNERHTSLPAGSKLPLPHIPWWCPGPRCLQQFSDEASRDTHLPNCQYQLPERNHNCSYCNQKYFSEEELLMHRVTVHGYLEDRQKKINNRCDECGKLLCDKTALAQHLARVHGIGNFNCDVEGCSKVFVKQKELENHKKYVHEGIAKPKKVIKCFCQFCGKGFTEKDRLAKHEGAIHLNRESKPFRCQLCQKTFAVNGYLKYHLKYTHKMKSDEISEVVAVAVSMTTNVLKQPENSNLIQDPVPVSSPNVMGVEEYPQKQNESNETTREDILPENESFQPRRTKEGTLEENCQIPPDEETMESLYIAQESELSSSNLLLEAQHELPPNTKLLAMNGDEDNSSYHHDRELDACSDTDQAEETPVNVSDSELSHSDFKDEEKNCSEIEQEDLTEDEDEEISATVPSKTRKLETDDVSEKEVQAQITEPCSAMEAMSEPIPDMETEQTEDKRRWWKSLSKQQRERFKEIGQKWATKPRNSETVEQKKKRLEKGRMNWALCKKQVELEAQGISKEEIEAKLLEFKRSLERKPDEIIAEPSSGSGRYSRESAEVRRRRLRRLKIRTGVRHLRRKLEAEGVSNEENEGKILELRRKLEKEPLPPLHQVSSYNPRPETKKSRQRQPAREVQVQPYVVKSMRNVALRKLIKCPFCYSALSVGEPLLSYSKHVQDCAAIKAEDLHVLECSICKKWNCPSDKIHDFMEHIVMCRENYKDDPIPWRHTVINCTICEDACHLPYPEFAYHIFRYHQHQFGCAQCPVRARQAATLATHHWNGFHKNLAATPSRQRYKRLPTGSKMPLPDIPWWCPAPTCLQQFQSEEQRDLHLQICRDELPERNRSCSFCGEKYFSEEELLMHRVVVHGYLEEGRNDAETLQSKSKVPSGRCEICGKVLKNKCLIPQHMASIHGVGDFPCDVEACSKVFVKLEELQDHKKYVHEGVEKPKEIEMKRSGFCEICGKLIKNKSLLPHHMAAVHGIGEKEDRSGCCELCGNIFTNKYDMPKHMATAHGIGDFICDVDGCSKVFAKVKELEQHKKYVHEGVKRPKKMKEKRYFCQFCGKGFSIPAHVRRHENASHLNKESKPFNCHLCGKGFVLDEYLKYHVRHTHKVKC